MIKSIFSIDTLLVLLLAIQVALQPILLRYYAIQNGVSCNKFGVIFGQESMKSLLCLLVLFIGDEWRKEWSKFSLRESIKIGGVLSVLYVIQHFLMQIGYQYLSPTKFNIINQTKTFWTALFLYFKMQKKQSSHQILALIVLVACSFLLAHQNDRSGPSTLINESGIPYGIIVCLIAAFLSAYSGIFAQIQLQTYDRNTYLFSGELGIYMSLVIIGISLLPIETDPNPWCGGPIIIPVFTNAVGAILVGLLLKYSSGESKGFALAIGIALTGIFESIILETQQPLSTWLILILVVAAMIVHVKYPYQKPKVE